MYFPALPLILLFASAICASPIHIGRRGSLNKHTDPTMGLPAELEDKTLYHTWTETYKNHEKLPVEGVEVAVKVNAGSKLIIVKIEVGPGDSKTVRNMILSMAKSEPPIAWYWHSTQDRRVMFILRMPQDDESKLKGYLGLLTKPTDESTGHVLKLPPRSFLSNLNVNVE